MGQLRVTALASTPARPMEGFVPRKGDGRFFGLNILGVSQTEPPKVSWSCLVLWSLFSGFVCFGGGMGAVDRALGRLALRA